ncbi:hypothetical protein GW17_00014380 [Ensete ventricosum]|nr:hypothetical protein GW17_00014380 [Ensete ventricosum]
MSCKRVLSSLDHIVSPITSTPRRVSLALRRFIAVAVDVTGGGFPPQPHLSSKRTQLGDLERRSSKASQSGSHFPPPLPADTARDGAPAPADRPKTAGPDPDVAHRRRSRAQSPTSQGVEESRPRRRRAWHRGGAREGRPGQPQVVPPDGPHRDPLSESERSSSGRAGLQRRIAPEATTFLPLAATGRRTLRGRRLPHQLLPVQEESTRERYLHVQVRQTPIHSFFYLASSINYDMYRWRSNFCRREKAFCSMECRHRQITSDEYQEKRGAGAPKPSSEIATSPYSGENLFFTGIVVS